MSVLVTPLSKRVQQLFDELVELSDTQRADVLDATCGDNETLRGAVVALLKADTACHAEDFLEWWQPSIDVGDALVGTNLGPYEIVERIAAGATGVVYRARRTEGFEQDVAVKVLRPWMADADGVARFRAEQQALADLPHPHIARLLDAGVTADGSHYLILEFVDGYRLDEAVEVAQPDLAQKIEWFLTICRAVAFAHEREIAHRDLKPANILMGKDSQSSDRPARSASARDIKLVPKITDFGLAKMMHNKGGAALTATGDVLGTPGYMAPEQICPSDDQVGPLTDIYGLGAVLYFLLTGKPPFRGDSITELIRELERYDPAPPVSLVPNTPADLNTICLKCLEKEPGQRYASANELADDVQRYLAGFPVRARPIGVPGRLVRWAKRNRGMAAALGALAVVVVGALIATTTLLVVAERRRVQAEREHQAALDTVDRLLTELSKTLRNHPGTLELRTALLTAAKEAYESNFAEQTTSNRRLRVESATAAYRLAQIYAGAGDFEKRNQIGQDALSQFQALASQYPDHYDFRFDVFHCHLVLGHHSDAYRAISKLCAEHPLPHYRCALANVTGTYAMKLRLADPTRSRRMLVQGLDITSSLIAEGDSDPNVIRAQGRLHWGLSVISRELGELHNALVHAEKARGSFTQILERTPLESEFRDELVRSLFMTADISTRLGNYEGAQRAVTESCRLAAEGTRLDPHSSSAWRLHLDALQTASWTCPLSVSLQEHRQVLADCLSALELAHRFWPADRRMASELAALLADSPIMEMRDLTRAKQIVADFTDNHVGDRFGFAGIVWLRAGDADNAMASFRRGGYDPSNLSHSSMWLYAALAHAKLGEFSQADKVMEELAAYSKLRLYDRIQGEIARLRAERFKG